MLFGLYYFEELRLNKLTLLFLTLTTFALSMSYSYAEDSVKQDSRGVVKQAETFLLEAQFAGPHQDTIIQRWTDKVKNNTCYLYIPVMIPTLVSQDKNVQSDVLIKKSPKIYGSNDIGSISCVRTQ